MEKSNLQAQFEETKKTLESSRAEINEFLKQATLDEHDRVRLTRVLQLIERYGPNREVGTEKIIQWRSYLETAFRFLPKRKKNQMPIKNISAHSFLLAEKTIASLRDLRKIDLHIEREIGFSEEEILNQMRSNEVERTELLDTSITLDYEKKHWGVERICLDGIQNHLPSDSKGEHVWIRCLVDGRWISLAEARINKKRIEAVQFSDDGVGFDVKNLALLYSTKTGEKESRGQFGEGMKMMAAAALREGLEPEMESQKWRAKPVAKEINLFDTRNNKEQSVQQLAFKVEHLAGESMIGSRTTFYKPTKAFINELMQIETKVLGLRRNYKPAFSGASGEIVDREAGNLFVKGIYVDKINTLLSYNFDDVETNRDRNTVLSDHIDRRIAKIIKELPDKRLVKTMLKKSILEPGAEESSFYNLDTEYPNVWLEAFYEAFGKDAVLDNGFTVPEAFREHKLNKIKLPSGMANLMMRVGVKTDKEAIPDFWQETIPTSLTLNYGEDIWNEERILLDAIQNHLPQDSGGTTMSLRFKTKDNQWHSFEELSDIVDEDVESVKISDNGSGYDSRLLGFFHSTKKQSESTGKFGEGLKMLCVAALRKQIDITLQSQNWSANPRIFTQEIGEDKINQLVFDVTHAVKGQRIDNDQKGYQSSSTTFSNLTPELLKEFREISRKVLSIERTEPIERTINGDILSLSGGMVYVRDILIPGDHNLAFTYHLPRLEIKNRDRSFVDQGELAPSISNIWAETENSEVIKSFLFKAKLEADKGLKNDKLEFTISFRPKDPEKWKKVFQEIFGDQTAIRDVRSQDFDAMHQNLHVGLDLLSFPSATFTVLQNLGLPTYESRLVDMTNVEHIPNEKLTIEERHNIEVLRAIDEYLPNNRPSEIRIYKKRHPNQVVAAGYSDGIYIHLHREILSNFYKSADVYVHEKTHHNTGGSQDASSGFRNYLSFALGKLAIDQLKKTRPDLMELES